MPDFTDLEPRVYAAQRNASDLFAMLGGGESERERLLIEWKGLTTPAEWLLLNHEVEMMQSQLEHLQQTMRTLDGVAKEIGGGLEA